MQLKLIEDCEPLLRDTVMITQIMLLWQYAGRKNTKTEQNFHSGLGLIGLSKTALW